MNNVFRLLFRVFSVSLLAWRLTELRAYDNGIPYYAYTRQEPLQPYTEYIPYEPYIWEEPQQPYIECFPCGTCFEREVSPLLLSVRHIGPKGIGYCDGYTTIEAFFIPSICECNYPFFDMRFHIFNESDYAGNVGVGYRFYDCCFGRMCGWNLYHDARKYCGHWFDQLGVGIELLNGCFDLRINGYIPLGKRKVLTKECHFTYPGGFFMDEKKYTLEMNGLDIEVGRFLINTWCLNVYGAIGPYFLFDTCQEGVTGGEARVEINFKRYFYSEALLSHDRIFGTRFQMLFGIIIPFGLWCGDCGGCECPIFSVDRHEIIPLRNTCCWDWNF